MLCRGAITSGRLQRRTCEAWTSYGKTGKVTPAFFKLGDELEDADLFISPYFFVFDDFMDMDILDLFDHFLGDFVFCLSSLLCLESNPTSEFCDAIFLSRKP